MFRKLTLLSLLAGLVLAGCRTQPDSPAEMADAAIVSLNERLTEVVDDEARSVAVSGNFKLIQGHFAEFREIQLQHRKRMSLLLRDYDSTEEEIMSQINHYNDLKEQKVQVVQALLESINATLTEAERKTMESEIRRLMESLLALTSAP
jgi:hypothetical protein